MKKRTVIVEHATIKFNRFLGSSFALICAIGFLALWLWARCTGNQWHDFIGELAAMVGFINLFTMQRSQNKDLKAIHLKLDELIASSESANNRMIKAEEAPEHVLDQVHEVYKEAAKQVKDDPSRVVINLDEADEMMKIMHKDLLESSLIEVVSNVDIDMTPPAEKKTRENPD